MSRGINPIMISMDDYFISRRETPKKPDGNYDYECLEALDIKLFNMQMKNFLEYHNDVVFIK